MARRSLTDISMKFLEVLETLLTDFMSSSFFSLSMLAKLLSKASSGSTSFFSSGPAYKCL
jgi:hypothetical protein